MRVAFSYRPEVLKQLQETETQMLKAFDAICMECGVEYFVGFGTALGAARHQGFLPWDDDVDVCMMREDFEHLLKTVPEERWRREGLELSVALDQHEAHTLVYPQVYKTGTVFQTEYRSKYDDFGADAIHKCLPIWLDIFLMDKVPSVEDVKKKSKKAFFLQKMFYYSKSRIKVLDRDPLKLRMVCFGKRLVHDMLNIDKNCSDKIYRKYVRFASSGKGEYITSFDLEATHEMVDFCQRYADAFPTVRVPFGDIMVSMQRNYQEALTRLYGDYMKMPPEQLRYNHPPKILDFGDGRGNMVLECKRGDQL